MCSDVGTEVVVETGLAFDFGPMASSIRWLIFDAWRDRGDLRVEQHHGQLDGSRSRQSKTEAHDEDANGEADRNTDARTRWRDGGANAEADGTKDATTRCGAA